ncbi:MAG: hypothetical protein IJ111_11200 [Eggerthellaceae bacterium]|nr:hypothetical protein [Eggerthellaceae bacterium]
MDDGRFEQMLAKLLRTNFSAGTEEFRDELLARCLAVLNADARNAAAESDADGRIIELDDAALELLAAAGDVMSAEKLSQPGSKADDTLL